VLRLSRFSYLAPSSLDEARHLLGRHSEDAVLMAGGTDVLVNIKHRLVTPDYVIGIRGLPELHRFGVELDGWLTIGAGVSLKRVEHDPVIQLRYPALAHAVHLISTPQVRVQGTIGGNVCLDVRCNYYNQSYEWRKGIGFCMKKDSPICRVAPGGDRCWAVASADSVPVLIALRSEVSILGEQGVRRVPLESLYQDDGLKPHTLHFGEVVTALHVPPEDGYVTVYRKFRIRQSFDFPLVGVSAAVRLGNAGTVVDSRVVTTAIASYPERSPAVESVIMGRPLDEASIEAAGKAMFRQAKPMDNTAGTIFHRKRMARVLLERALREIAGIDEPVRQSA